MSTETDIAEIKTNLINIKEDTTDIRNAVFGNGGKGLKTKVIILEVKFWIIFVLLTPIAAWTLRGLIK